MASDRIKDSLQPPEPEVPIIIVHNIGNGRVGYVLAITEIDPQGCEPELFGLILSDLVDHIVHAYRNVTGRDERDIRPQLYKFMRDKDRFKQKEPSRGNLAGKTFMGPIKEALAADGYPAEPRQLTESAWFYEQDSGVCIVQECIDSADVYLGTVMVTIPWDKLSRALDRHNQVKQHREREHAR